MRVKLVILMLAISVTLFSKHSIAASSEWQDLGGGKARLHAVLDPKRRTVSAALEVRLEPGWSTYWRYPGSSGIPPRFDFSQSRGFLVTETHFPAPSLISPDHEPYAGYKGQVVFPMVGQIDVSSKAKINLQLLIGVCATVCIPAQASFTIQAKDLLRSDPLAIDIINVAMNSIPEKADSDRLVLSKTMGSSRELHVKVALGASKADPKLFVEGPYDWYLTPARLLKSDGGAALFALDVSRAPSGADIIATPLTYTLVTNDESIEFRD